MYIKGNKNQKKLKINITYMLYYLRDHLEPFVQPTPLTCLYHQLVHETPMPQSEIKLCLNISNDRITNEIGKI